MKKFKYIYIGLSFALPLFFLANLTYAYSQYWTFHANGVNPFYDSVNALQPSTTYYFECSDPTFISDQAAHPTGSWIYTQGWTSTGAGGSHVYSYISNIYPILVSGDWYSITMQGSAIESLQFERGAWGGGYMDYNCNSSADMLLNDTGPTSANTNGSILFPTSTYIGPDFTNWALHLGNLATNTIYQGQVDYQVGNSWTFVNNIYSDPFSINTGNATSVNWTVHKSQSLFNYQNNNGTTSQWIAQLNFNGTTTAQNVFTITPFATSAPVTYNGANLAGPFFYNAIQQVATVNPQFLASSSQILAGQCQLPSDWTDVGGGIRYGFCSTINYLLVDNGSGAGVLGGAVGSLEGSGLFSSFFTAFNAVTSTVSTMSSSTAVGWQMPIQFGINQTTTVVTLIPANAEDIPFLGSFSLNGVTVVNEYFNLMLDFLILFLLGLIVAFTNYMFNLF